MKRSSRDAAMNVSRRRFVQSLGAGTGACSLGLFSPRLFATDIGTTSPRTPALLSGTDFDLTIGNMPADFTGRMRPAVSVNGSIPGPTLRWREGTSVTLRVHNHLPVTSSIHWHGIILPFQMDGVPGISYPGIAAGDTFTARFQVKQSGTYWYHGHSHFQEQTGLYGAIIIDPAKPDPIGVDRDYVVMLNDWTDEDPDGLYAHLKKVSNYYNYGEPTMQDFIADASRQGVSHALASRRMWNQMRMSPRDLVDVTGATYTYLMNGNGPAGNWTALFRPGERVRLRFINGSSNSFFDVRIPGLNLSVIAADGQNVDPVEVDEFRIGTAEVYDVIVQPREDRAYTIFAQSMSRDGYARGTLAPRAGMQAEVPNLDPLPTIAMVDMMGSMAQGGGMSGMRNMTHGGDMHTGQHEPTDDTGMVGMPEVHHARTEYGPNVDMRVDMPRTNLDDPGIGLRDNGRRVLTYADLHTIGGSLYEHEPVGREIELHLTGNMERFIWGFDGLKFSQAKPVHFRYGEHLRLVLVNDTMMTHPIHLHGMWSELESPAQKFQVRKHTICVQPAQRVTYRVLADALGRWAYHCHLLYHMEAGMFREVVVS